MKRAKSRRKKDISVAKRGDVVRVRLTSCYNSHDVFFEGEAPMNDERKVESLLLAAEAKGLKIPKTLREEDKDAWF